MTKEAGELSSREQGGMQDALPCCVQEWSKGIKPHPHLKGWVPRIRVGVRAPAVFVSPAPPPPAPLPLLDERDISFKITR